MVNVTVTLIDGKVYKNCSVRSSNRSPDVNLVLIIGKCDCYRSICKCVKEVTVKRSEVKSIELM